MLKRFYLFFIFVFPVLIFSQNDLTPFEILEKIDKNMVFKSAYSEIDMIISIKGRKIIKKMSSYSVGNDKSFIEFLSPARDKGTKMLKKDEIIKIYYPSAERILRLSGHMLRRSMMGSDFSYEDMTERSRKLKDEYSGERLSDESIEGRSSYVIVLTSKIKRQTYFTRKIWVDKERFIGLKEELYSKSGKLLKILKAEGIRSFKKRFYPTIIIMEDKLRQNSSTRMEIKKIEFDIDIPESTFMERNLLK